jgi:hypothetical protein
MSTTKIKVSNIASVTGTGNVVLSASPTFTGTVGGITKSMVGLGNVDNTTDALKPVSGATQTALGAEQVTSLENNIASQIQQQIAPITISPTLPWV